MPFTGEQFAVIAATLLLASFVQSAIGFGMAMVSIPLLVWNDIPLPEAIALVLTGTLLQATAACVSLRSEIPWPRVAVATMVRGIGVIAGVGILAAVAALGVAQIKQLVGAVLLVVFLGQWLWRTRPREEVRPLWTFMAFLTSGVMAGTVGMGGPTLVLWAAAQNWPVPRIRAFLLACFLVLEPLLVALLVYRFGVDTLLAAVAGLVCTPILLFGAFLGLRFGRQISPSLLQGIALTTVVLLVVGSLAAPWLS